MKCTYDELNQHLQHTLASLYIVNGDEPFLVNEVSDAIRERARALGHHERVRLVADNQFDWTSLPSHLANQSLFSERRIIDIHVPDAKFSDKAHKVLVELATQLPDDTVILITTSKLDTARQRAKWFKALEAAGVVVTIWPLESKRFALWLKQRLAHYQFAIQADALQYLVDHSEGNVMAAHQDIEKFSLLYQPGTLTLQQVREAVNDNSRYDVFKLTDACLLGDAKRAAKIFSRLQYQGTEAIFILWALVRECRLLLQCHDLMQSGQSLNQFAQRLGIWPQRRTLVQQALKRLSRQDCYHILNHALTVDAMIKGAAPGNSWTALLDLCLLFTGIRLKAAA